MNFALRLVGGVDDDIAGESDARPSQGSSGPNGGWDGRVQHEHGSSQPRGARNVQPESDVNPQSVAKILGVLVDLIRGNAIASPMKASLIHGIEAQLDAWESARRTNGLVVQPGDRQRLEALFKDAGWASVQSANANDFLNWMGDKRQDEVDKEGKVVRKRWVGSTCNKVQTLLSTLLKSTEDRWPGTVGTNWAKALPRASTHDSDEGSRPLWWPEVQKFLAYIKAKHPERLAFYSSFVYTAMRRGEVANLQIEDCKFDGSPTIKIVRNRATKKGRTIHMDKHLLPLLKEHIGARVGGPVFEEFVSRDTLLRDCRNAGIDPKDVGLHSFRKAYAGRMAVLGKDYNTTAKVLGHDPKLTQKIYTKFQDHELAALVGDFGDDQPATVADAFDPGENDIDISEAESTGQASDAFARHGPAKAPPTKHRHSPRNSHLSDSNRRPALYKSVDRPSDSRRKALTELFYCLARLLEGDEAAESDLLNMIQPPRESAA